MNNTVRILIVGAGIAGLSVYRALKQQGLYARIIEKNSEITPEGAAICLPANAMLALAKLGLAEQVKAVAHQVTSIEYALASGQTLSTASLFDVPCNQAEFVALKRSDLMSVLGASLLAEVEFNKTITSLDNQVSGVNVVFNDQEQAHFDLVIAADGIHSATRTMALPATKVNKLGVSNWRFIADIATVEGQTADINAVNSTSKNLQPVYYIGNESAFMLYPINQQQVYCYGQVIDTNRRFYQMNNRAALTKVFASYCQPVQNLVAQLDKSARIISGELTSVSQVVPITQRIIFIGDALHGCPPSLQQGAALAFEDANCLARVLAVTDIDNALSVFSGERLARINYVVNESNKIIKLAGLGRFTLGRLIRNFKIRCQGPANVVGWRKLLTEKLVCKKIARNT
ncbi:MAG: FAD-dependent monooxygenase [Thalassotalea sp.]